MEHLAKKLINWASILEPGTREQAQRTAAMPFIWPHLALMPDAHQGKGATIGSVIPTFGTIMPAAVGVDIGCFLGETRVPLLDGRQRTLKGMAEAGGTWWVHSLDASGQVVPGRAVALKTRTNAELMKVTVSGGDEIVCTPDHQFMMVDRTYRQARELRFNDSLMPLYRKWQTRDGYESVSTGKRVGTATITRYVTKRLEHFQAAVIAVEALAERDDVYCLQVEEHHNFALAAGVFVHNCGMIAVRTGLVHDDLAGRPLARLREAIEKAVPLSAGQYNEAVYDGGTRDRIADLESRDGADSAQAIAPNWRLQLGSLGSGNHFIEVSLDEADRVWLFLHSGSRGVGNKLATRHIKVAQQWCERAWIPLPDPDLAYLVEGTPEFWAYLRDLRWAQHFALLNREEMMARVTACLAEFMGRDVAEAETIQCFAGETPVMTRNGCAPISTLADGIHELLTAGGEWVKAPVQSFGKQQLIEVILSRSGVLKTVRATPSHRWLLRTRRGYERETITSELKPGDRLQFSFPKLPSGRHVDTEAACRGFVYGDGSNNKYSAWADFCGHKDEFLLPLFGNYRTPRVYPDRKRITGLLLEWKLKRPPLDSPPSVLYGWLAGYFAADGDVGKTGRPTLASASRDNLEYVRLVAQEIGIGTFGIRKRMRLGRGKEVSAIYLVGLMRGDLDADFFLIPDHRARFEAGRHASERRGWNVVSVRPTGQIEEVYCAVVPVTHSFALEDNILTGNCHHNYTEQMSEDMLRSWKFPPKGRSGHVWLSRKGAIDASQGKPGLIPGSMGTRSYVVTGKGNKLSLNSSPHGAGREYSRSAARKTFTRTQLDAAMEGIEWRHTDAFLDEIPGAYKPIDQVMADAAGLVAIRHTLRQIVNVKGE
jgi:RNA-splicing ligase RtcB